MSTGAECVTQYDKIYFVSKKKKNGNRFCCSEIQATRHSMKVNVILIYKSIKLHDAFDWYVDKILSKPCGFNSLKLNCKLIQYCITYINLWWNIKFLNLLLVLLCVETTEPCMSASLAKTMIAFFFLFFAVSKIYRSTDLLQCIYLNSVYKMWFRCFLILFLYIVTNSFDPFFLIQFLLWIISSWENRKRQWKQKKLK